MKVSFFGWWMKILLFLPTEFWSSGFILFHSNFLMFYYAEKKIDLKNFKIVKKNKNIKIKKKIKSCIVPYHR